MRKLVSVLIILFLGVMLTHAQSYHTIDINGLNDGWTLHERFTNISPSGYAYFTWDADYIYFAIAHDEADYGNMATFMYFDTDPAGNNGTTDAYAWWFENNPTNYNITTPFKADYVVVWKNQSGADYIEVKQWDGSSWANVASANSLTLNQSGTDVVKAAIGTDYREVFVKRSFIGNPVAIKFCTFTEQQWGSYWRYFAWPNNGWTDAGRAAGQSIPHYYGFILTSRIRPVRTPYYDASFNQYVGSGSDWATASNWSKSAVPTSNDLVIIPSGKNVEISASTQADAFNLSVSGTLTIKSNNTGTGSLIHDTTVVNATVERYIPAVPNWGDWESGWHLLSSPVASQSISGDWTPSGDGDGYDFYAWSETTRTWLNQKVTGNSITTFEVGKGYMVAYQQNKTQQFSGNLNVNNVSFSNLSYTTGQGNGWHLLGNPFASPLKWNDGNWALSNVAANCKIWNSTGKAYTDIPSNGIIPMAQGFFIQVSSGTNSLTIPAAARVHNTQAWYKNSDVPGLKLVARPADNSSAQEFKLRIEPDATVGYDFYNDSRFLPGYAPQVYALVDGEKLSTSAIPALDEGMEIALGFRKTETDAFVIELAENTLPAVVYLKDLKTGLTHNLTQNPVYSFTSAEGDMENRFKLAFASVGIEPQEKPAPVVYAVNNVLYLHHLGPKVTVEIYTPAGQLVQRTQTEARELPLELATGIYLVKVNDGSRTKVEKVFIR